MVDPEPVVTGVVCSLCGLSWSAHGERPSSEVCVRLLRAELTAVRQWSSSSLTGITNVPPVVPYQPPLWTGVTFGSENTCLSTSAMGGNVVQFRMIRGDDGDDGCAPVGVSA